MTLASCAAPAATARQSVFEQAQALLAAQSIPRQPALDLIHAFADEGLAGPFKTPRRFSAINGDGFPFQWSVSLGESRSNLRFLTDCGIPGTPISERIEHTRARLGEVARQYGLTHSLPHLDAALAFLLPDAAALDATLMGLCIAVDLGATGALAIKVYVNSEVGDPEQRYERFTRCLRCFGRTGAIARLRTLQTRFGPAITPAFSALELLPNGIGSIKLYFRTIEGDPRFIARVAQAAGCEQAGLQLQPLHRAFCKGEAYPPQAIDFSVEFPAEGLATGFKLDLNVDLLFGNDAEADERVLTLLNALAFKPAAYAQVRDRIAHGRPRERAPEILFVGLGVGDRVRKVNVYFHPFRNAGRA
jgi:hypothetical protein